VSGVVTAIALGVVGQPAYGQGIYVASTPTTGKAPSYTGWAPITFQDDSGSADSDEGVAELTLPFAFSFYGKSYSKCTVTVNGLVIFDNGSPAECDGSFGSFSSCTKPHNFPDSAAPNAMLGIWWSDMDLSSGSASYTSSGTSPDRIFSIKYSQWGAYDFFGADAFRNAQVDFHERTGAIRVYFGSISLAATNVDEASFGIEDGTGQSGVSPLACGNTKARCGQKDWPEDKYVEFTPAVDPDLLVVDITGSPLLATTVNGKPGYKLDVTTVVKNQGKNLASGFVYDVYLSTDATIDANDTKIGTHAKPESLNGFATGAYTEHALQFEKPVGSGNFYIGVLLDPQTTQKPKGDVLEALETNNTGVSAPYVIGAELDGNVSGPTASGPGEPVNLHVIVRNRGTDAAGPFSYEVWLSSDKSLDSSDKRVHAGTLTLAGGQIHDQTVSATLPAVADGAYYYLIVVDPPTPAKPKGDVTEADEGNNTRASTGQVTTSAADVLVEDIAVLQPVPPYGKTTRAYFAEKLRVSFKVTNKGGATAKDIDIAILLSDNAIITLHDVDMTPPGGGLTKRTYLGGGVETFAVEVEVPAAARGAPLPDGNYFVGVIVDSTGRVPESNEANNIARAPDAVTVRQPAMDLTPVRVDVPVVGAVGEVMPVYRVIRNLGNRGNLVGGAAFEYRYVLSSNEIISVEDIPLSIMVKGQTRASGEGRIDVLSDDRATDLLRVPSDVSPGTYFIGLITDPDGRVAELDERNNTAASVGTVEVVPSSLRVETSYLPDGLVGVVYHQHLVAAGGDGVYRWELEPGQGELPNGLSLSADGVLSGVPAECSKAADGCTVPGGVVFTVRVSSGGRTARARLVLRTVVPSGSLAVLSSRLPVAIRGVDYEVMLVAVGGVRPYSWSLEGGTFPDGITLLASGRVSGRASRPYPDVLGPKVSAVDAHGNRARGDLSLRCVEPGTLVITTSKLGDAVVGVPYTQQLQAVGGKGALAWKLSSGVLPESLRLSGAAITGVASQAGLYPIGLSLDDSEGNSDGSDYILTVLPRPASFRPSPAPEARPGEPYSFDLSNAVTPGTRFALFSGEVPPGLSLDRRGSIAGTVDADASPRAYNFVVEVVEESGARALAPLSIYVVAREASLEPAKRAGCASGGAGSLAPSALVLVLLAPFTLGGQRTRRRHAP
jgi:subtilase family serine protease